jgi:AGZA family xanthine/uracil permease-like MFS transporter
VITLLGVRSWLAASISPSLKHSFAVGIGLFMALIGLYETGLVASAAEGMPWRALVGPDGETLGSPPTPLRIGDLRQPEALLALGGFLLIATLLQRRVRGAILLGMAATALAGGLLGLAEPPRSLAAVPFTGDYALSGLAFTLDVPGVLRIEMLPVLLTLFLMGFLDTLGTLVGVGAAGGLLDEQGDLPQIERPMLVDAASCVVAGLAGTTTSGAYIESAAGIREGARTGLAAVATGALFALALPFAPLLEPLQRLEFAYAPALIAVGVLMVGSVTRIDFHDLTELVPAFSTIAVMAFTYNIANGLTAGLVLHPLVKLLAGRGRELTPGGLALGALCATYYVFGLPH